MSDEDDEDKAAGAPLWMATFADLMSLLMCFFVLILSFSELDVIKYKQIAESMKDAFGVQQKMELTSVPKGTSVVATEFQPGIPQPTPFETIQQVTTNQDLSSLRIGNPDAVESEAREVKDLITEEMQMLIEETELDADMLRRLLKAEIEAGQIDVESEARTIIIRIREKGSFPSGSAQLDIGFLAVLDKTGLALNEIKGSIFIEGHTDNVPIGNARYGSNWDLSAARAVAVAEHLLEGPRMDPIRLTISGHADTRPQAPNDSWEGRAQNRRVEVIVKQPLDESRSALIQDMRQTNPEAVKALDDTGLDNPNFEGR
jgi:chemotaxis protein MotB